MKQTLGNHRRLTSWVIVSLLMCALMPFSSTLFDTLSSPWKPSAGHAATEHSVHVDLSFDVSAHHPMPHHGEVGLCNDEPARLPSELLLPPLGTPTLALMTAFPASVLPLKFSLASGPRTRYPPGLRFHLTLGRIQV